MRAPDYVYYIIQMPQNEAWPDRECPDCFSTEEEASEKAHELQLEDYYIMEWDVS